MLSERVGGAFACFLSPLILSLAACQGGWETEPPGGPRQMAILLQ